MKNDALLSAETVRELFHYNPDTGVMKWRVNRGRFHVKGKPAGSMCNGYYRVEIDAVGHYVHRLAWLYEHGVWPPNELDHINGDRADNCLSNLRLATRNQNQANARRRADSTCGLKGVTWHKGNCRWKAQISLNNQRRHIGYFSTAEEAHGAYLAAASELFGTFARAE